MAGVDDDGQDRVILNCGGVRHETFLRTLQNFPETRLTWSVENKANNRDYDPEKKEFFFDRHPGVFAQILNFYRTGKLHAPHDVCGPLFQDELMYWGIDEKQMEPCCWSFYTQHREAQESLKAFEGIDASDNESDDELGNSGGWTQEHSSKWQTYKVQIWNMFENHRSSKMAKTIFALSLGFIIISVIAYILQTLPSIQAKEDARVSLTVLETICSVWFTIEFVLRLVVCPSKKNFFKEPMNWIDLFAILPVFLRIIQNPKEYPADKNPSLEYDILAAVRLFRLFRFFKVNLGFLILKQTMIASSRELLLLVLLVLIPVVIFATIAYICEREVNKKEFQSIPDGLWWAIITITTVGYGDSSPVTFPGKFFASFCALASIIITALPISIIGNNFSLYYSHAQAKMKLPKKSQKTLIGAANALMMPSARRSDEISVEEIPIESDKPHEGMNGSADGSHPPHNIRRARRARSSLYAGGVVPRMSLPTRARSNEDIGEDETSPPEHRKKSYTSTQTTTIDTPPKSPPHFGNMLTVSQSDISENILDMSCPDFGDTRIVHNEVDEFGLDDIDRAVAKVEGNEKKDKTNGFQRPGTPVKRSVKHSVRFVKPTLTVTTLTQETGSVNDAFVEELKEEPMDESSQNIPILPPPERPTSPVSEETRKKDDKGSKPDRYQRGKR
ncbi:potassium voltage-gated channel protein Shaw [Exaiptasia diaphana]|uniref:BTB domain-containing protein n=1 Tax=Exaiptasia diaphana TaxID=2652724 RepID=A0A913X9U5_EXADI|nr:potassium voltage-gated channel protein Shaw [Exaiptasia diaphana]KXJ13819.1 Potassium voltage-gated channel protein Shaw [Exaiptasia diaphana]